MPYFPLFTDLSGKSVLVVGGGIVALRKVEKLLPFTPILTVVAPDICAELRRLPALDLCERAFRPGDEANRSLVIAATNDRALNREISLLCREKQIPVNVVDDPELCTFLFPALIQRGSLTIGISTGGSSPTAAIGLKEQIQQLLPERFDEILDFLHQERVRMRASIPSEHQRHLLLKQLYAAAMTAGRPLTTAEANQLYQEVLL